MENPAGVLQLQLCLPLQGEAPAGSSLVLDIRDLGRMGKVPAFCLEGAAGSRADTHSPPRLG